MCFVQIQLNQREEEPITVNQKMYDAKQHNNSYEMNWFSSQWNFYKLKRCNREYIIINVLVCAPEMYGANHT